MLRLLPGHQVGPRKHKARSERAFSLAERSPPDGWPVQIDRRTALACAALAAGLAAGRTA